MNQHILDLEKTLELLDHCDKYEFNTSSPDRKKLYLDILDGLLNVAKMQMNRIIKYWDTTEKPSEQLLNLEMLLKLLEICLDRQTDTCRPVMSEFYCDLRAYLIDVSKKQMGSLINSL